LPEIKEDDSYGVTFGGGFPLENKKKINFRETSSPKI
tara:strand:+ start:219 stop:329 length:111 start_codon:yes stop_codon:yes gene_type:complete